MNYEDRIVLFLDILGFKNIIDKTIDKGQNNESDIKNLYDNLEQIGSFCIEKLKGEDYSVKVTQFSDSIIVSFLVGNNDTLLNLIRTIQELIIKLVNNGLLSRGAISYGKLIHEPRVIFGPALNDAYETETDAAMYPRVILDKSIIDLGKGKKPSTNVFKEHLFTEEWILSYLSKDTDEKYYINYFPSDIGSYTYVTNIQNYLSNLRTIIINGLKFNKPSLKVKYGWMKNKYNGLLEILKTEEKIREISKERGLFDYITKLKKLN